MRPFFVLFAVLPLLPISAAHGAPGSSVEVIQPVCPVFLREAYNPVLGFRITVAGDEPLSLRGFELGFSGTTRLQDIAGLRIVEGTADPSAKPGATVVEGQAVAERIELEAAAKLAPGEHWFWLSVTLAAGASIDGRIGASLDSVKTGDGSLTPVNPSPEGAQRIGQTVRLAGEDGVKAYRIPGLVRTGKGTLLAVYDVRHRGAADLPADIDVGVSRSSDGGQSWEPMKRAIDMGDDPAQRYDGVGDPAVLVDPANGRIWVIALWSHGNRSWHGSGPGLTPDETGQLVIVSSDDDGRSWSAPRNLTSQVKDPAWRLLLGGPGAGIALKDGTLVFAAQFRAADGRPWSTVLWSKDHGGTWGIGTGVKSDTTEAQVAELADGAIMINCRDDRGGARSVAVTRDLGRSWQLHPTDRQALQEPVCMASLLGWPAPQAGGGRLWFSNPDATDGRHRMTIKLSADGGMSWPEKWHRLYDSREGFGYSCLAPADDGHLGVLYEGTGSLRYLRFPLEEWVSGGE